LVKTGHAQHCGDAEGPAFSCMAAGDAPWFNHLENALLLSENMKHTPTNVGSAYV